MKKKKPTNKLISNSAITLIVLIITIIVLLILSAVSLNMVLGENGIITKAKIAKQKTNQSQIDEEKELQKLENYLSIGRQENVGTLYGIEATQGNGTEEKPYNITNADQLLALSNLVNGGRNFEGIWFALVNDIELDSTKNWLPIGTENNKFKGNFNGNNHLIRGLFFKDETANNVGLFGYAEQSIIKNIRISSEKSSILANQRVGAIAGEINNSTIENCINEANIYSIEYNAGGIVGRLSNSSIKNCTNTGNINSPKNAGAIIGYIGEATTLNTKTYVINCTNNGNVNNNSKEDAVYRNGGIVGRIYNLNGTILIKGCTTICLNIYGSAYNESNVIVEN